MQSRIPNPDWGSIDRITFLCFYGSAINLPTCKMERSKSPQKYNYEELYEARVSSKTKPSFQIHHDCFIRKKYGSSTDKVGGKGLHSSPKVN